MNRREQGGYLENSLGTQQPFMLALGLIFLETASSGSPLSFCTVSATSDAWRSVWIGWTLVEQPLCQAGEEEGN